MAILQCIIHPLKSQHAKKRPKQSLHTYHAEQALHVHTFPFQDEMRLLNCKKIV